MKEIWGRQTSLFDEELLRREQENREYLMRLDSDCLLLNYRLEAGRPTENYGALPKKIHGGWEFPTCQLRGHFTGHWLSAAAMHYYETGDQELKAKADAIVAEIGNCQKDNGGQWAASIPEKYFRWIGMGKNVWAPHYTVHKTFRGLVDMYLLAGNRQALEIADSFADWFVNYSGSYSREEFDNILDYETGGMLEIWADLLAVTGNEKYRTLLERYYRSRLFDRLLAGEDPLTNMHANTTIPEILGCARAYEVTGEQRWRDITQAYWNCAVTDRGSFATGGQTLGEVWTPKKELTARLGDKNQEHCTVYNMMRLAEFLFRWTKDPVYAQYIEKNLYNGIMAQAYWKGNASHGLGQDTPQYGLLTYFLPLRAGGRKGWASETEDFFCCHGTMVQANAAHNRAIYYQDGKEIYVCQYLNSKMTTEVDGQALTVEQREDTLSGSFHFSSTSPQRQSISDITSRYASHPDCRMIYISLSLEQPLETAVHLRIPEWAMEPASVTVNGTSLDEEGRPGSFFTISRQWSDGDTIGICLKKGIRMERLAGDEELAAFTYGPLVLAGLCEEEHILYGDESRPEQLLVHENEREWGSWKDSFRTRGQERTIHFLPVKDIGYQPYTVYFPVRKHE